MLRSAFLRIAHLGCLRNLKIVKNNTGDLIVEITDRLAIDGLEMLLQFLNVLYVGRAPLEVRVGERINIKRFDLHDLDRHFNIIK